MDPAQDRQLLAIMFTDVVGYTALTGQDEAAAVRVRDAHRARVRGAVAKFGGEVVDATGDESLSIFHSAQHAVDCALALQAEVHDEPELSLRIGIHLGDVLRSGDEIIGDGVNVAARIRPLAEPGGICVSETVYQMLRNRDGLDARPLGARQLKNVAQPLRVYALGGGDARRAGRWRRPAVALAGLGLVAAAGALLLFTTPGQAFLMLNLPRLVGASFEQQVNFAETEDGVRIAYATAGNGPPVLVVLGWATHLTEGFGSALYDQSGFLGSFARRHRVVRYDGRGFGLSDRDITDFSLDARVRDMEAVVAAAGLERFAIYALSAGGTTAVSYAVRHPERVTRLVLAATWVDPVGEQARTMGNTIKGLADFVEHNWHNPAARAAMAEFLAPEASAAERRVVMHFLGASGEGPQMAGFLRELVVSDAAAAAAALKAPALVIGSEADRTVPLALSRRLAALLPGARLEVVPGAGHIDAAAQDPRVIRLALDFLAAD